MKVLLEHVMRLHWKEIITLSVALVLSIGIFSCATKNTRDDKSTGGTEQLSREEFEKLYMKEGFIDRETFRIIILAPVEECESDLYEVKEKARKRAISTLQKYLVSENRIVDQKSMAEIITIVNNNGNLVRKNIQCQNNNVFFYDIKKENLQRYLYNISRPRE